MNKLPDATTLAQLRRQRYTYHQIGEMYGASWQAVWDKLNQKGLFKPTYPQPSALIRQSDIGTTLALIRQGVQNEIAFQQALKTSRSNTYRIIRRLIRDGLVQREPGKFNTLRLTAKGEEFAPLVIVAQRRPDGGLEKLTMSNE